MTRLGRDAADWQRALDRGALRQALARAIYEPPVWPLGLLVWRVIRDRLHWYSPSTHMTGSMPAAPP